MRRHVLAAVAALTAISGCSDEVDGAPAASITAITSSSARTAPVDSVTAETITACRDLAEDEGLAEFWSEIHNTGQASAVSYVKAANAIRDLELYTQDPAVEDEVQRTMRDATLAIAADPTLPTRVEEFREVISPIVYACQEEEIDMGVE